VSAKVYTKRNQAVVRYIKTDPNGPVAKDMLKRGVRVQSRARKNLNGGSSGPRRINTGLLRTSIGVGLRMKSTGRSVRIGTDLYYSYWVHEGTGLYGPKHRLITPKRGKVLVFPASGRGVPKSGKWAGKRVVRSVKGMKPNHYLTDALRQTRAGGAA
jgi:hypothetical protein